MLDCKVYPSLPCNGDFHARELCYFIFPGGLREDLASWLDGAARKYGMYMVAVEGVDWNNDLTPWEAAGVFRRGKPFGGRAPEFVRRLLDEVIVPVESGLWGTVAEPSRRRLAGVSLSGLFALWASMTTSLFGGCICISGSLWYDGFARWIASNRAPEVLREVCLVLGEKEKDTRDARMSTVEDATAAIAEKLLSDGVHVRFLLVEGTHFSPVVPRLEMAFGNRLNDE